jgi:hypothetical protein
MDTRDAVALVRETAADEGSEALETLLAAPLEGAPSAGPSPFTGTVIGRVIGFADNGATPLVVYPGQPTSAALPARTTRALHAAHIGRDAVIVFEQSDPARPIILGCLHTDGAEAVAEAASRIDVEVDADGQRLVLTATDQIVLRCGKASITLTKEGKVLLQGTYVSSQASGAQRIRGGSVQIN